MTNRIVLRPHHILCSQFFTGRGYSDEFVKHMTDTLNILNNENPRIEFAEHCDEICSCCPKNEGGACINEERVMSHDSFCLNEYGLNMSDRLFWKDIKAMVLDKIKADKCLPSVCDGCQWASICLNIYPRLVG